MDSLYTSMTGAMSTWVAQAAHANNLANVNTVGFKAQLEQQSAKLLVGSGFESNALASTEIPGNDFSQGGSIDTGNPLDIRVDGEGWLAVTDNNGNEAYTRRGDLSINGLGLLTNGAGHLVLGDGGPINVPTYKEINIAKDGTISIIPPGAEVATTIAKLKLVSADSSELKLQENGLFASAAGEQLELDPEVTVRSGALEGSNVSPVGELLHIIALARQHELDVKMMSVAEENDEFATQLLKINNV